MILLVANVAITFMKYDGGVRVPFIFRCPNVVESGESSALFGAVRFWRASCPPSALHMTKETTLLYKCRFCFKRNGDLYLVYKFFKSKYKKVFHIIVEKYFIGEFYSSLVIYFQEIKIIGFYHNYWPFE